MQLPTATAHYGARVRFGRYVARRLKRARFTSLATDATKATAAVLAAGRAAEDADGPVQDAMADRDATDDVLDAAAQDARARLAGRSADAATKTPYTQIFPEGIGFYTAAPLDEENARYSLFSERLAAHLPASDKVRTTTVAVIDTGLADFAKATQDLTAARNAASIADGHLSTAEEAWEKQMEKTYGALVVEVGRAAADQFFPRTKTRSKKASVGAAPDGG